MGDQSHDAPGFEQFYALIWERPRILEGVVDRIRGKLVQVQGNVNQVQGDLGTMNRRVYSLGQDIGALRGEISTLESSVTSQLGSNDRYMGTQLSNITQMLAGILGSDKPQLQEVRVAGNQQAVVGSQGSPCPPGPVLNLCLPADRTVQLWCLKLVTLALRVSPLLINRFHCLKDSLICHRDTAV